MNKVKLCKDCKWCMPETQFFGLIKKYTRFSRCTLGILEGVVDKITGKVSKPSYLGCENQRFMYGACGNEGKLWEAKE